MAATWSPRRTPPLAQSRDPSPGELMVYQTGVHRYPNLGSLGSFRSWDFRVLFPETDPAHPTYEMPFNCIAWSLGHTDRWIDAGTVAEMERLCKLRYYEQCTPAAAEVELYRVLDEPAVLPVMLRGQQVGTRPNPRAYITHAHRRDNPTLDTPPGLGCSSKMGPDSLIAHNRGALVDNRGRAARQPVVSYGSIFQYWQRSAEHPSRPGKEGNQVPAKGHAPDHPIFERGYGTYPPGHPGNTLGRESRSPSPAETESPDVSRAIATAEFYPPQSPALSFAVSSPSPSPPRRYRRLPKMHPYDRIPYASVAAADSAEKLYIAINDAFPSVVTDFETRWKAWQKTWFPVNSTSSSAFDCCIVPEFEKLVVLGPKIVPLVVYKLAVRSENFVGVCLYNGLEKDEDYLVDPDDLLNYKVLQRQANLIVDMNYERNKIVQARTEAWKAHCIRSRIYSSSSMYTECDDFDRLSELGGSIIAHIMLEYAKEPLGFWYELVHELVHGFRNKTGLRMINFGEQYVAWSEWFQKGEHSQAPQWIKGIRAC